MTETVLIVVAHSDDESISMAGTIRKHVSKGDMVYVVSMTDGVGARNAVDGDAVIERKKSSIKASEVLDLCGVNATVLMITQWTHTHYLRWLKRWNMSKCVTSQL